MNEKNIAGGREITGGGDALAVGDDSRMSELAEGQTGPDLSPLTCSWPAGR